MTIKTKRRRAFLLSSFLIVMFSVSATNAYADKQAEALFAQGKKAMEKKEFDTACKAFEESQRIEPLIGTQMNIGLCYEQWNKVALAHRAFRKAQRMAESANDTRAPKISERAAALEKSVSLLRVRIPDDIKKSYVTVSVDDIGLPSELLATDIAFEPGEHILTYQVGTQTAVQTTLSFRAGKRYQETVSRASNRTTNEPAKEPTPPTQESEDDDGDDDSDDSSSKRKRRRADTGVDTNIGRMQRIVGLSLVAGGSVAMGVSGVLVYSAKKDYKDALAASCAGSTTMCDAKGLQLTKKARKDANIATVVFSVGLGTAIAGGVVYLISPSAYAAMEESAMFVSPQVDSQSATFVFGGQF